MNKEGCTKEGCGKLNTQLTLIEYTNGSDDWFCDECYEIAHLKNENRLLKRVIKKILFDQEKKDTGQGLESRVYKVFKDGHGYEGFVEVTTNSDDIAHVYNLTREEYYLLKIIEGKNDNE